MIRDRITTHEGSTHYTRQLQGIDEMIDIAKAIDGSSARNRQSCSSITSGYDFTHTNSLSDAVGLAENGWPEGRKNVQKMLGEAVIDDALLNLGQTIEYRHDVAGDEPDIDRYLAGEPENMVEYLVDPSPRGRNLKLIVNSSQHAFMPAEVMARRGVAVVLALELLTTAGYGIELELAEATLASNYSHGTRVEYRIPIVQAGQSTNLDTVAFSIAHPSFLRRLVFALNESEPDNLRETMGFQNGSGYGMPDYMTPRDDEVAVVVDKDDGLMEHDALIPQFAQKLARKLIDMAQQE